MKRTQLMSNAIRSSHNIVLEAKGIYKQFKIGTGIVEVIRGVDVIVEKGDFIILFGISGCGKSTLLNILLGLEEPTRGYVKFMGKDLYGYDEDQRSQIRKEGIGLVYQQQNWVRALNVLENVAFPLALRGYEEDERNRLAIEYLKTVGMQDSADQIPTELSSGQQQKVSFVRALISKPSLLVADEPTGNLDSKSGIALMDMFKEYNEQGNTIIMVTHDLGFLTYATRSLNMSDGLIVKEYKRGDKELDQFKFAQKR